jgi:acetoin utilization deacetylase AcuC-like enzyme
MPRPGPRHSDRLTVSNKAASDCVVRTFFHPGYVAPLRPGHRFPMSKYQATRDALAAAGAPLVWAEPEPAPREAILAAHAPAWVSAVVAARVPQAAERRIGFPVSPAVARRSLLSVGGTLAAADAALRDGIALTLAGGSHHAMPDAGAGYCVLNDLAVAALVHAQAGRRVLVIDLDVHQGDGTAVITAGHPGITTFSIHCEKNFPVRKARSSRDVALPAGTGDGAYLEALAAELPGLIAGARPDLVLLQAGVDPHCDDRLGHLSLTDEGLLARDALVRAALVRCGIPFAVTLGGGYDADVPRLGRRHARTLLALAGAVVPQSLQDRDRSPSCGENGLGPGPGEA